MNNACQLAVLAVSAAMTSGLFAGTVLTNDWLGACAKGSTSTSVDLDDSNNWSLGHVPDQTETAKFNTSWGVQNRVSLYNFTVGSGATFAPSAIWLNGGNDSGCQFNFDAPMTFDHLCGVWEGTSGHNRSNRFKFAPNATETTVFTFTGNRPIELPGLSATWGSIYYGSKAVLDFTASDVSFGGEQKTCNYPGDTPGGGDMLQTGAIADSATLRFGVSKGTIRLYGNPTGRASLSAGYAHVQLRTDQQWLCDATGFLSIQFSQGKSGAAPRYLLEPIDVTNRLDNLGNLNVVVIAPGSSSATGGSLATGQRILGGTYGSFRIEGGNTSFRDRYISQQGDVTLCGTTVVGKKATTYGFEMYTSGANGQYWKWIVGAGNSLVVSNGVHIYEAMGTERYGAGTRMLDMRDATVWVGGDFVVDGVKNSATNSSPSTSSGWMANAGTKFTLGGSFINNYKCFKCTSGSAAEQAKQNQNLAFSTVELIGGAAEKTWEVCDQASTHAFSRNSFAISNLCVGTATDTSNVRLVNVFLNENPTNRAEGVYINEARYGEKLVAYRLAIAANSTLNANTQNLEIGGELTIDPTGTLRVDASETTEAGDAITNVVGIGDQSEAWSVAAARVIDTSNPKAVFKVVYDSAANVTRFVRAAKGFMLLVR